MAYQLSAETTDTLSPASHTIYYSIESPLFAVSNPGDIEYYPDTSALNPGLALHFADVSSSPGSLPSLPLPPCVCGGGRRQSSRPRQHSDTSSPIAAGPPATPPDPMDVYAQWLIQTPPAPPLASRARRQCEQEFEMVVPNVCGLPAHINHTNAQLKAIASEYGLRRGGTKAVLRQRLHAYMVRSWHAARIQAWVRGWLFRRYLAVKGLDGAYRPRKVANEVELHSLDPVEEINIDSLFNIPNEGGIATLYDIESLKRHIRNQIERHCEPTDPYTNMPFKGDVSGRMQEEQRLAVLLGRRTADSTDSSGRVSIAIMGMGAQQSFQASVVNVCAQLDSLGHISDPEWFLGLSSQQWRRLCVEMADIWSYRAGLTPRMRQRVGGGTWPIAIPSLDWAVSEIRSRALFQVERLVFRGDSEESRALGAYYVLIALTMVSDRAAEALPCLHQAGRLP
jgi:hypothetical protein